MTSNVPTLSKQNRQTLVMSFLSSKWKVVLGAQSFQTLKH